MTTKNLLVELLVEELPPKALKKLGASFASLLADSLSAQGLASLDAPVTPFATPRRLGVHVGRVRGRAPDKAVSQKLMPVAVGLDAAGAPTPALRKKLQALGLDDSAVPGLKRVHDGKADVLYADTLAAGASLQDGLQAALAHALAKLPIPKVMGYQLGEGSAQPGWSTVSFVRPAHGLVALYGADVVAVTALGLSAGRTTQGHRFESTLPVVTVADADSYAATLARDGAVIVSFAERRVEIVRQLAAAAAKAGAGLVPIEDEALLDEVTGLVERPHVVLCQFEPGFLAVPQECLILTMKANQKYFPLLDAAGRLSNQFLVVSNINPADASAVIGGNERVVRPRLADAKFFFDQDRKKSLQSRVAGLDKVVYHNKLGTQGARSARVAAIARLIGAQLGGEALAGVAEQAASLAKTDLLTDMVGEFPELQGTMGGYYARHDGLSEEMACAVEDHYKPRFAGDTLPRGNAGLAVALADKLETLVGLFGIGNLPTGDKDPFALRRHALGVLRMLTERALPIDLPAVLQATYVTFGDLLPSESAPALEALKTFVYERLSGLLREQGYSAQEVDAVVSVRPPWGEFTPRLSAVRAFAALPEAPALAAANKRVGNILKKADGVVAAHVAPGLLQEAAEKALYAALQNAAVDADAHWTNGRYTENLQSLAALKAPVDAFFEDVMVNAPDPALKANRLGLLAQLHAMMNRVADLSKLAT